MYDTIPGALNNKTKSCQDIETVITGAASEFIRMETMCHNMALLGRAGEVQCVINYERINTIQFVMRDHVYIIYMLYNYCCTVLLLACTASTNIRVCNVMPSL